MTMWRLGNEPGSPMQKLQVLLTTEPSPHSLLCIFVLYTIQPNHCHTINISLLFADSSFSFPISLI